MNFQELGSELTDLLALKVSPMTITFSDQKPDNIPFFEGDYPEKSPDGRTGKVSAGCVFWMHGSEKAFTTVPEDHGNCSVGSLTHGLKTLDEVKNNSDVQAILECGWVELEMVPNIPVVSKKSNYITYKPINQENENPDVVFLRVNAKQAMTLKDAFPDLIFEGKPQCHIVPIAKEQDKIAISVGCTLSRVRTGMPNTEMTVAIPARKLQKVVEKLKQTCSIDYNVSAYASQDASRFR